MAWNAAALDQLTTAWLAGKPPGVIARSLGPGYTRDTVERQALRMGLKRPNADHSPRPGGDIPSQRPAGHRQDLSSEHTPVVDRPRFAATTGDDLLPTTCDVVAYGCKWPIGEVGTEAFGFCGRQTRNRRAAFCERHAEIGILTTTPEADRRFFNSALRAADKQAPAR